MKRAKLKKIFLILRRIRVFFFNMTRGINMIEEKRLIYGQKKENNQNTWLKKNHI